MAKNEGVRRYVHYTAVLPFPEDEMVCGLCPFLHKETGIDRYICTYRSGEIILYPMHMRGDYCQLQPVEDEPEVTE